MKMQKFLRDNVGANLVEYIILVGVVALLAIGGFSFFKDKVVSKIKDQGSQVEDIGN